MSRDLSTAARAALTDEVVRRTLAVELDFPSGALRACGAPFDTSFYVAGTLRTFLGVGTLGGVSSVEETAELRAVGLTLTLSGIPRDTVQIALAEDYQGRRATVWEVLFDPNEVVIADPVVIFRGRMDTMTVALGDMATVRVALENRLADWERPRVRRYTAEDQGRQHPGDAFFSFLPATTEKELVWPARSFFR